MNKKFYTWMASALLAGVVGTVQAQNDVEASDPTTEARTTYCGASVELTAEAFVDGEEINSGRYYFIQDENDAYLSLSEANSVFSTVLVSESVVKTSLDAINHALWKVEPQVTEDGGVTRFCLTNKATGMVLSYDPANATTGSSLTAAATYLGGAYPNWKWFESKFDGRSDAFGSEKELSVVFQGGDSTMVLATDAVLLQFS